MKYTFDEQVNYEVRKIIGDRNSQNEFFGKAIGIQNGAYREDFANYKFDLACETLLRCDYCHHDCERCKLHAMHEEALADIAAGLRVNRIAETRKEPEVKVYTGKNTITLVIHY